MLIDHLDKLGISYIMTSIREGPCADSAWPFFEFCARRDCDRSKPGTIHVLTKEKEALFMKRFENSDWLVLNSLIYKIYTTRDFELMRSEFLEQLRLVLDFDSAQFRLANEEGELGDTVAFHDSSDLATQYEENDYCRGLLHGGKSIVYRESDVISEEVRSASEYYNKVYVPNGWHYSIHMVLCHEERLLGEVTLYRKQGKSDFHYDDVFLLDMLKEHLSYRLDREWKDRGLDGGKMTIKAATLQYSLTKREETILRLLLAGEANDQICEELCISVNTLKKHVLNLYRKLGIRNDHK